MLPNWGEIVWREALTVNSVRTFSEETLIILIMLAFHGACRIAADRRSGKMSSTLQGYIF
jgi:hypothetical protein